SYHFMARVVAEAALCNIKKTEKAAKKAEQTYKSEVILSNAKELMTPEDTSNGAKDSESEQLSNASSTPLNYDPLFSAGNSALSFFPPNHRSKFERNEPIGHSYSSFHDSLSAAWDTSAGSVVYEAEEACVLSAASHLKQ